MDCDKLLKEIEELKLQVAGIKAQVAKISDYYSSLRLIEVKENGDKPIMIPLKDWYPRVYKVVREYELMENIKGKAFQGMNNFTKIMEFIKSIGTLITMLGILWLIFGK